MKNVIKEDRYIRIRNQELNYFQEQYKTSERDESISPSKRFSLTIEYYEHVEGIRHYNYSLGTIRDTEKKIFSIVKRNYSHFPFQWIQKKGREYILCGIDYQGYTIIDLETGQTESFIPEEAYEGHGFCWAAMYYQTDTDKLIVDGCYWACPYELVVYDISEPMQIPYKELFRVSSFHEVKGWANTKEFEYFDEEMNVKSIIL